MIQIKGSEALIKSLIAEGVKTIFGYPGGQIMPVFDTLFDYRDQLKHILVRHEQGATHAAQGYARVSGDVGVVFVTSGPGATNVVTGVADAMVDSTPLVVVTGQVPSALLGTDAFQEADVVGITQPVSKWSYQIRRPEDVAWAVARAFYIARSGRPGPVVLDFTKDAQIGLTNFEYKKCNFIRSYNPIPKFDEVALQEAIHLINTSKNPLVIAGQGVVLGHAEAELDAFVRKADLPVAFTLLGLSALPSEHSHYKGMVGMHGNVGPNIMTNTCDLLIAVGMRFDDRVTSNLNTYAKQAKVIHIDIDPSEISKNVRATVGLLGDAKMVLDKLTQAIEPQSHPEWHEAFDSCHQVEVDKVIGPELNPLEGPISMGEVVALISEATSHDAIVVTDVGQNQMSSARYFKFTQSRSLVTSGGLGTMGFGLPAAIGAKVGRPDRTVCFFTGDGGIQMTLQELGTIMQENLDLKIIVLNNSVLGMVRQWQELFYQERYSETTLMNPDFVKIAEAYGIKGRLVKERADLALAIDEMLNYNGAYLLEVFVEEKGMIFPMVPGGACVSNVMLNPLESYK